MPSAGEVDVQALVAAGVRYFAGRDLMARLHRGPRPSYLAILLSTALIAAACAPAAPRAASEPAAPSAAGAAPSRPAESSASRPAEAATPAAPIGVRAAYAALSALQLPIYLAQDAGLFQRYGLDVELVYIQAAPNLVRSLMAGEIAFGQVGPRVLVEAAHQGADVVLISNTVPTYGFSLYGDPRAGVQRGEDLRGKPFAVTQRGAATDLAGRRGLREFGLVPDEDVPFLHVKDVPAILTTVLQGIAAGGVLSPPSTLQGRQAGLVELINLRRIGLPYLDIAVGSRRGYLAENREMALRWLRAYSHAIALLKDDREAAERAIGRYTSVEDPALLAESYTAAREVFTYDVPLVPLDALQALLETAEDPALRGAPPERFVDQSLVEQLVAEGFYTRLQAERGR